MSQLLYAAFAVLAIAAKAHPQDDNIAAQVLAIEHPPAKGGAKEDAAEDDDKEPSHVQLFPGCKDSKGIVVLWEVNTKIKDAAQATFDKKKRPVVQYNPAKLRYLHDVSRTFFHAHECAHHVLGHLYAAVQGVDKEQQADCWAVHALKRDDKLNPGDLEAIQQDLSTIGRLDENHSAGARRASNLKWCLTDPMPHAPPPVPAK